MNIPEIDLKLTEVKVEGKSMPLPSRKEFIKRLPRKIKKMLKKKYGKQGFINWLNEPIKYVVGEPIYYYIDAEKELTRILLEEISKIEKNGSNE